MMPVILDIETIPAEQLYPTTPDWLRESKYYPMPKLVDLEQYKREDTKEKYRLLNEEMVANFEPERIKEFSVNHFFCEPICVMSGLVSRGNDDLNIREWDICDYDYLLDMIRMNLPLTTFCGKPYDLPVLSLWCAKTGMPVEARRFSALRTPPYDFSTHADLYYLYPKCPDLDTFAKLMGIKVEKHGSGADIYKWHIAGKKAEIEKHCEQDIRITYELAKKTGIII